MPPNAPGPKIYTAHVVADGWHAAIVVPRAQLVETGLVPEVGDFPKVLSQSLVASFPFRNSTLTGIID